MESIIFKVHGGPQASTEACREEKVEKNLFIWNNFLWFYHHFIIFMIILYSGNFWSATPASPLTVPTVETVATTYPSGLQNCPKFLNIWCTNCHVDVSWLKIPAWHISLNINSSQPWAFILTSRNLFFNRLPYISTPYQHFNTCAQLPNQTSRNRDDDNKFLNLFQTTHVPIWTFWNLIYPCPPNLAFME